MKDYSLRSWVVFSGCILLEAGASAVACTVLETREQLRQLTHLAPTKSVADVA